MPYDYCSKKTLSGSIKISPTPWWFLTKRYKNVLRQIKDLRVKGLQDNNQLLKIRITCAHSHLNLLKELFQKIKGEKFELLSLKNFLNSPLEYTDGKQIFSNQFIRCNKLELIEINPVVLIDIDKRSIVSNLKVVLKDYKEIKPNKLILSEVVKFLNDSIMFVKLNPFKNATIHFDFNDLKTVLHNWRIYFQGPKNCGCQPDDFYPEENSLLGSAKSLMSILEEKCNEFNKVVDSQKKFSLHIYSSNQKQIRKGVLSAQSLNSNLERKGVLSVQDPLTFEKYLVPECNKHDNNSPTQREIRKKRQIIKRVNPITASRFGIFTESPKDLPDTNSFTYANAGFNNQNRFKGATNPLRNFK